MRCSNNFFFHPIAADEPDTLAVRHTLRGVLRPRQSNFFSFFCNFFFVITIPYFFYCDSNSLFCFFHPLAADEPDTLAVRHTLRGVLRPRQSNFFSFFCNFFFVITIPYFFYCDSNSLFCFFHPLAADEPDTLAVRHTLRGILRPRQPVCF